jgi:hypothetical protein
MWICVFPGKMGWSWKEASGLVHHDKESAEAEAAKNCNVQVVPHDFFLKYRDAVKRMQAAEHQLRELGFRIDYGDDMTPTFVRVR